MPEPIDKKLYELVKKLANEKFKTPTSIYRSTWIVKEYRKRGGKYQNIKSKTKTNSNMSGLQRWFLEKWIDLNRPIKDAKGEIIGYQPCGRKKIDGVYPLCRPSVRINKDTPKTYLELSKSSIKEAKRMKRKDPTKNVLFN
jgi:hypothetical protein